MALVWHKLLARPDKQELSWFRDIADQLLYGCKLLVNGVPHRIIEVEAYYHGPGHEDPFAHRDPLQLTPGRWYFHRTGGQYRGGSFKGLDLSFGHRETNAYGGMLIRGVETPDGTVIDGPSLTVDHVLKLTRHPTVKSLDATIDERLAWHFGLPVTLQDEPTRPPSPSLSFRVGLSLKKRVYTPDDRAFQYLFRPYRYLAEPNKTAKGKPHMVLPLIAIGWPLQHITDLTGCPTATIRRYAADFATGRTFPSPEPFYGKEVSTADLCKLYGLWWERYGRK